MSGMAALQHVRTEDPYRCLFLQLAMGAGRCRVIADGDRVVGVELLDENPAFAPYRGLLPALLDTIAQGRTRPATCQLRSEGALLAISVMPSGADEVMIVIDDVTAREVLEQRLREAQGRFEQAFHGNAAAMVIAHQRDLRIIDVNPRWLELFGATRDEVLGRTSVELGLITDANASTRIAQHRQFANGYDVELELQTRAGAPVIVLASARPIEITEGHCTLTTLIDITGRKHAEEAFETAFNASPAGMMLVEVASDVAVAVNTRLLELTGATRDDLVGRRAHDLALTLQPTRDELLAEIARTGKLDGVEVELASTRGSGVWTLASTEVVTLRGKLHRLSAFTDIVGRKRLERRLLTQHVVSRSLAEASNLETEIPRVLDALCRGEGWDGGAVWLADGAVRCRGTWCRPAAGFDVAQLLQTLPIGPVVDRLRTSGAAEELALAAGLRVLAFPILLGAAVLGVVVLVSGGRVAVLDAADRGMYDSIGRMFGLFVERARAEDALRELNSELEHRVSERTRLLEMSNRDLEAFGSSVSHDLRAPLRAIHGFSQILLDDAAATLPAEACVLLTRIHAASERMRDLINGLLAFSQIGRGEPRKSRVELDPLVRSVLDELLVGRGLTDRLELHLQPLGCCWAEPALLRPVWTNLIDNALKYARNRERVVLDIGREERAGEVVYYVRDNGVGFDMAHVDRLFGVFQRLHTTAEFEGIGIGLANVRRIVERHHGWIAATSELGRGSRFEFSLGPDRA
jgi:PAS domain S-box-containing protein